MKADVRDYIIRELGCTACHLSGAANSPCEKHHLNEGDQPGRKRRGERETVGLCQWHHVGRCWCNGFPIQRDCRKCKKNRGPSWYHHKREFLQTYGNGDQLLAKQNERIEAWRIQTIGLAA